MWDRLGSAHTGNRLLSSLRSTFVQEVAAPIDNDVTVVDDAVSDESSGEYVASNDIVLRKEGSKRPSRLLHKQ
jgi:hypothetical protein